MKTKKKTPIKKKKVSTAAAAEVKDEKHAFKILGQKYAMPNLSMIPKSDRTSLLNYYKITKIIEAENKLINWKADWSNSNQYKYNIWHYIKADAKHPAGFGFSHSGYDGWLTFTYVCSGLCLGSEQAAMRVAKKFEKYFINWKLK